MRKETLLISEKLISDLIADDRRSFRMFYDLTYPFVCRQVRLFISHTEDCQDVVSEVFYQIWKNRDKLISVRDMQSWLFILCRNEAFHLLKQNERLKLESIDDLPVEIDMADDDEFIDEEMRKIYRESVNGLPQRCKMIFLLAKEEGMSYRKIAELLSITEGTVAQQMTIAIRRITEIVRKKYQK
jgi:RNA polymerase sigma-70 factor (ECF subfamily)